ncbi:type IV conjugative transfer system lipoprotein TraV [Acidovorax sp. sic0104]|uniref:type IV conjugative transfer system lipoprotein TraV n=1 Tax=Acidovorax sp. sic0104 TaxID=2854784 RepID=UPI002107D702|nr:type IV conjugative transfer system lipoprotein TraV [Acidovorax sp. sic0104]
MTTQLRSALAFALGAACLALVGCSSLNTAKNSDFACDNNSDCPTPLEVYSQTNHAPASVKNGRTPESWKQSSSKGSDGKRDKKGEQREELRMDLAVLAPSAQMLMAGDPAPQPLREPSQVMRIWIAPWTDQSDNLNWSGYVYSEVTTRRWAFGEQEVRHQGLPPQFLPRQP